MMSSQVKLISSLAVLASSVAIVSPLELGASATLPVHLATAVEVSEQAPQSTPRQISELSPLEQIAAQVRGWESNGRGESEADVGTEAEDEAQEETQSVKDLDKNFRQYVFNKYGGFFFGDEES